MTIHRNPGGEAPVAELAWAVEGRLSGGYGGGKFHGAGIDSRTIPAGSVFFAVRGERTDGHKFVGAARKRGAAAVVVMSAKRAEQLGLKPLGRIASYASAALDPAYIDRKSVV